MTTDDLKPNKYDVVKREYVGNLNSWEKMFLLGILGLNGVFFAILLPGLFGLIIGGGITGLFGLAILIEAYNMAVGE